ncbi:hypothetical protein [Streptacidiphilus sp. MAP5-52]|uniref:hypothetical protein n=1 Tax=Streptacidiphilus sp. MAP5-52 TaxID=3156267 RepID=UPI0035199C2C
MPIRPENLSRYPSDWPAISLSIKTRAAWRCECEGECGRASHTGRCPNVHGQAAYGTGSRVVLTTAHLNHQPEDCDPGNLRAMCQGCHLHYDLGHHRVTAAATRAAAIAAAGQLALVADDVLPPRTEPRRLPPPPPPREPTRARQPALLPAPRTRKRGSMARISIKVLPEHEDGSPCEHPTAPTGLPRDPASCSGRRGYRPHCSVCGAVGELQGIRSNADSAARSHREQHATAPVPATT